MKQGEQKLLILFCAIVCISLHGHAQTITTIAGGGTSLADGIPATSAKIGLFAGTAVDRAGNVYIAAGGYNTIRKVSPITGNITTVAGTGIAGYNGDGIPATTAELNHVSFVAVDSAGNLYINDAENWRIRKINASTGIITTVAGTGVAGYSGDGGPATLAQTSDGAQDIAVDNFGNLYISDGGNYRIRKVDTAGIITTIAGTGVGTNTGDGGFAVDATISGMFGICTDARGNVYSTDSSASIRKINVHTGIITRVAGTGDDIGTPYTGDGLPATSVHISPLGVCVDDTGNIYIADYVNERIEKVDTFGIIHTIAGTGVTGFSGDGGVATDAKLNNPENVVIDKCGNVYIADDFNQRARKVTYPPNALALTNTITASPGDTVCTGSGATYSATVTSGIGGVAYSYQWYVNGSIVSTTGSSYSYTPANGDNVRCVVAGSQECSGNDTVSSNTINMVVTPVMVPTITVTAPASALAGSVVTVDATVTGAGSSYSINWYDNGVLFRTTTTPMVSYVKDTGVDVITATVVPGSEGCYDTANSNAVSVSAGNTGISNIGAGRLHIYPNPVGDVVHVNGAAAGYRIMSVVGSVLLEGKLVNGDNVLDVSGLAAGVYVVEVTDGDGVRSVVKVVKE